MGALPPGLRVLLLILKPPFTQPYIWILLSFIQRPSPVLAMPTISGLSALLGRVVPRFCVPPYGHSVKGMGGADCGVVGQPSRREAGESGFEGADDSPYSRR